MTDRNHDINTMQGMIWNTNHVLEKALDPKTNGIPRFLFQKAKGLIVISVMEAGIFCTGKVGTGILLGKRADGMWSAPSAMGLAGIGWGAIMGGSVKDIIVFIFDDNTLRTAAGDGGIKFGGQAEMTLGFLGRSAELSAEVSNKGLGRTASVSFSKGAFGGVSAEGCLVGPRKDINYTFYGKKASPTQIIFEEAVMVPDGTMLQDVYAKLRKLAGGDFGKVAPEHTKKVQLVVDDINKSNEQTKKGVDLVQKSTKPENDVTVKKPSDVRIVETKSQVQAHAQ